MLNLLSKSWISLPQLNRSPARVVRELEAGGYWTRKVSRYEVYLVRLGWDHVGICYSSGEIHIPDVSLPKLQDLFSNTAAATLRDILRHEYAHAIHFSHPRIVMGREFREIFTEDSDDESSFVSAYAALEPCEDFAETFMFFLKHKGDIPKRFQTREIRRKWRFIEKLAGKLKNEL